MRNNNVKYYLDTCIWIAYFMKEEKAHEEAKKLFEKIINNKNDTILVSGRHTKEMAAKNMLNEFEKMKDELFDRQKCYGTKINEIDKQIAFKHNEYLRIGLGDILHLIIAYRENAMPVSFDKHWEEIGRRLNIRTYKPQELI